MIKYIKRKFYNIYKLNLFFRLLIIKSKGSIFKRFVYKSRYYNVLILIAIIFNLYSSKYNITKTLQINKKVANNLDWNLNISNNKKYEVKSIYNNAIYIKKT